MTLRHFDSDVDLDRGAVITKAITVLTETVKITPQVEESRSWLLAPPAEWSWEQLRDYVVHEIEARFGAFPRNFKTEHSIFKSFSVRWGDKAGPIAVYAFDVQNGRWGGAPISVNRFCKASDSYFGAEIAQRL